MSRPKVGVLAVYYDSNKHLEEFDFFKKLCTQGEKRGLEVMIFTPDDVSSQRRMINGLFYDTEKQKWERRWSSFPEIIYDRGRYQKSDRFERLKRFRVRYRTIPFLNYPMPHKWGMFEQLVKSAAIRKYLPVTVKYNQASDLSKFLRRFDLVYMKPSDGTGGRGIIRIERVGEDEYLVQGRDRQRRILTPFRAKRSEIAGRLTNWKLSGQYLIQQGIPITLKDGRVHDYRLLIQKNGQGKWEVTGCAGRIGPERSITSNLHGGGSAVPMEKLLQLRSKDKERTAQVKASMEQLAFDVAHHCEKQFRPLCEIALDIAVDPNGGVWLLEMNPKPAREVFQRIKETETYEKAIVRPLEYAEWMLKQRAKAKTAKLASLRR